MEVPSHWLVLYRLAMTFVTMVSFQELWGIALAILHVARDFARVSCGMIAPAAQAGWAKGFSQDVEEEVATKRSVLLWASVMVWVFWELCWPSLSSSAGATLPGTSTAWICQGAFCILLVASVRSAGVMQTRRSKLSLVWLSLIHLGLEQVGGIRGSLAPVLGALGFGAAAVGHSLARAALQLYRSPVDEFVASTVAGELALALILALSGTLAWSFLVTSLASLRRAQFAESHAQASTAVLAAMCDGYLVLSSDLQVLQSHDERLQGRFFSEALLSDTERHALQKELRRARANHEAVTVSARLAPLFGQQGPAQLCCSWFPSIGGECLCLMAIRFSDTLNRFGELPDTGDPEEDLEADVHELTVGTAYPFAVHRTSAGLEDILGEALLGEGFALRLSEKSEQQGLQQWIESNSAASPSRGQRVFGPVRLRTRATSWDVTREGGDRTVTVVITWCTGEAECSACLAQLRIFVLSQACICQEDERWRRQWSSKGASALVGSGDGVKTCDALADSRHRHPGLG